MAKNRLAPLFGMFVFLSATGSILSGCTPPSGSGQANTGAPVSVYDRVIKAGKFRVGYVPYPPGCIKDPNTGKLSGIFVDTLEEAAKSMDMKVEWTEEVGWGTMIEGLQTDRYDLIGSAVWPTAGRGKLAGFSVPICYSVLGAYVRRGDTHFKNNLAAINSPAVKIATIDGEISEIEAKSQFPNAQRVSLPQNSQISQMLLNLTQSKADVALVEPFAAETFLQSNPGTIENIAVEHPLLAEGNVMMFKRGQGEFKSMLDTALTELINKGFVDKVIDKYDPHGSFYRVAYPYRLPNSQGQAARIH